VVVELDRLLDPALVPHTVAESLKLREQSGRPPMALLVDYLAERRVLLVLDNRSWFTQRHQRRAAE
jgi:non-specific serine/threonine protein kinase